MRVGISTSVIQRGRGGVGQHLLALIRRLLVLSEPLELVLFVLEDDAPLLDFARADAELVLVPEWFRPAARDIVWHQTRLPMLARELRLDAVHVPSYRRLLWARPCPLVATIHDLAPFHVQGKYDWKRMLYGRVVCRRLAQCQDAIIAVSHATARDITEFFGVPRSRITVIHNGVDHERFKPGSVSQARSEVRRLFQIDQPFFLYIARLEHPGKNHLRLISAFEVFKARTGLDWLLVLGGSDWHGATVIHTAIKTSPVAQDIRCLGFVADETLPVLYRAAEAFVYPSLFEGFGMPAVEAMACGCPVVCSPNGSLGEVVADAACLVDPEDIGSIATELCRLALDTEMRRRLTQDGLKRAARFDWNSAAKQTLTVYQRVCGSTTRAVAMAVP